MNDKGQKSKMIPPTYNESVNEVSSSPLHDEFSVSWLQTQIMPKLIEITRQSGAILQNYAKNTIDTVIKKDGSPVTPADEASDDFICDALQKLTPHIAYVSEERFAKGFMLEDQNAPFWLVDPLDGTQDYINRTGDYAVCIALIVKNKPILGVIAAPDHGRTFTAIVGGYAFEYKADGTKIRLQHASEMGEYCPIRTPICSGEYEDPKTHFPASLFENDKIGAKFDVRIVHSRTRPPNLGSMFGMYVPATSTWRPVGSALKFGLLATREVDIYACKAGTAPWDTAAGEALLKTLGGRIATITGSPLDVSCKGLQERNPEFLAFAPGYTPERL